MQSTGDGESLPYSLCMKVSKFQLEDKSKTQRVYPCSAFLQSFEEIKKAWSWMHLPTWGLRLPYTNKRKQLTPQNGRLPTGRFIKYACTKTMRQACAGRRRERPSYSLCMKVSKFQVENKRKLYLPWNIDFWNGKRWHLPFLLKKNVLKQQNRPLRTGFRKKSSKALVKGARVPWESSRICRRDFLQHRHEIFLRQHEFQPRWRVFRLL